MRNGELHKENHKTESFVLGYIKESKNAYRRYTYRNLHTLYHIIYILMN